MGAQEVFDELKRHVIAKQPIIYMPSWEEERVEAVVNQVAQKTFKTPVPLYIWTSSDGLRVGQNVVPDTLDIIAALDYILRSKDTAIYLFKDVHPYLTSEHRREIRKLRDVYQGFKRNYKTLILLAPVLRIPADLDKEILVVDFPLPTLDDLSPIFDAAVEAFKKTRKTDVQFAPEVKTHLLSAARGLTADEARAAFDKAMAPELGQSRWVSSSKKSANSCASRAYCNLCPSPSRWMKSAASRT